MIKETKLQVPESSDAGQNDVEFGVIVQDLT